MAALLRRAPDCGSSVNGIDTAEDCRAQLQAWLGDPDAVGTPIELTEKGLAALPAKGSAHA